MEYTKGPWEVVHEFNVQQVGTRRGIATTGGYSSNSDDAEQVYNENIANAQLIAAAPDMYEALKFTYNLLENMTTEEFSLGADKPAREMILQTLAKTEGK